MSGRVLLVGAGPGDPDLLTVRAVREIGQAQVLLYDALIDPVLLDGVPSECECLDVGKRGDGSKGVLQEEIADLMIRKAREGSRVVRLKGGDPFVFGRGGEEASALREAGISFEVVPGVSSALAVPAYAGIPVTDRRVSSSFAVVTGHRGKQVEDTRTDWEGLASSADTLVILMGTAWVENIVQRVLDSGRDPATPAAAIASGTTPRQQVVRSSLAELPAAIVAARIQAPTIIVIGEVARLRETLQWFEQRPLFGCRVLVARATGQQGELATCLRRAGAEPVPVALLAFERADEWGPLEHALSRLQGYDWLVFTSANAVRFSIAAVSLEVPDSLRVACVGSATACAAREAGLRIDVVPEQKFLPEELADAMAQRGSLAGARVLFPRATRARPTLANALEARGARVDALDAYRTFIPPEAEARLRRAISEGLEALTLTSPSTVDHLFSLLGETRMRNLARGATIACIGPTTADRVREYGLEPDVVSSTQTSAALVESLESWFEEHPHGVS